MAIKGLNPYLNFDGSAEQAIALYQRALGATVEVVSRFSEVPGMKVEPEHMNRVMHAALRVGGGTIMLSDSMPGQAGPAHSNMHVMLDCDDAADMATKFEALAQGGKVAFAIHETFWGAKFGMLTDSYGIQWMFNCEPKTT